MTMTINTSITVNAQRDFMARSFQHPDTRNPGRPPAQGRQQRRARGASARPVRTGDTDRPGQRGRKPGGRDDRPAADRGNRRRTGSNDFDPPFLERRRQAGSGREGGSNASRGFFGNSTAGSGAAEYFHS